MADDGAADGSTCSTETTDGGGVVVYSDITNETVDCTFFFGRIVLLFTDEDGEHNADDAITTNE